MSLSPAGYPANLDPSNPKGTDPRSISDDQHRNILQSIKQSFPNCAGPVTATHTDLNKTINLLPGYGGIRQDATNLNSGVIGNTPVKLETYNTVAVSNPIGTTQDNTNGQLTIQAGIWLLHCILAGRIVPPGDTVTRTLKLQVWANSMTVEGPVAFAPTAQNTSGMWGSISTIIETPVATSYILELYISVIETGRTIQFQAVDYLELSANRVGPRV